MLAGGLQDIAVIGGFLRSARCCLRHLLLCHALRSFTSSTSPKTLGAREDLSILGAPLNKHPTQKTKDAKPY